MVDNVTLAVTVVGTLVVVSGLLILIGAVAMTKFRRVYEAAILKTLGATRQVIATMLLLEYGVLGVLAGRARRARAPSALTWALSRYRLRHAVPARPPRSGVIGIGLTGLVVSVGGRGRELGVLQRKPLATLRAE